MKKTHTTNIALVGNQNCGKTTFFNAVTGQSKKTGNFPGVTIEKSFGYIKKNKNFKIYDLPGLYSLSVLSQEEKISESFLKSKEIDIIFNIIDSTNIQRNLFLTFQLAKLKKPMIVIFNMADELKRNKGSFDIEKFSKLTGLSCVFTSARKSVDIDNILSLTKSALNNYCFRLNYQKESEIYPLIDLVCDLCLTKSSVKLSKADNLLLNKYLAFPVFIFIMAFIFSATFSFANKFSSCFFNKLSDLLYINIENPVLLSFIRDGVIKGTLSVLSFLPVVLVLFFFLSILEDSGYMARISYITDKIMKKAGLSGKAFFPAIIAFGCSVPAIMATRTLSCDCERKCTMKLIPFISCSAKLPVYLYICSLFSKENAPFIIMLLYIFSTILGCLFILIFKNYKSEFILELPPYRIPTLKNTFSLIFQKSKDFFLKVFGIIIFVSIIIWGLSNFDLSFSITNSENSILSHIARRLEFIFHPIGLGNWKIIASLLCGIGAKEAIISSISVLSAESVFNPLSSISFLIFVLLYTPCISTLATIKKESGSFMFSVKIAIFQFVIAWTAAFIFYSFALPFFG